MEGRKRACDRCSSIKQVCAGGATCQRCSRLGLECTFERLPKPLGRPKTGSSPKGSTSHGNPTHSSITRGQRARNPRSRFGCLNCRLRRKKCDENWPECGDCARLRLECSGPYQHSRNKRKSSNDINDLSSDCLSVPNSQVMVAYGQMSFDLGIERNEMDLLTTFVKNVSSALFSAENSQVFLGFIVPLCLEDSNIRNSVLGMTAAYMAGGNDCYTIDYMLYKTKAEMSLSHVKQVSDQSILSILLISILEVLDGSSVNWRNYLDMTYRYINQRGGLRKFSKISPLTFFISQIFCYMDFMSSLSTCSAPLIESSSSNIGDGQNILTSEKVGATFRVGIAGEIVSILGRISSLASMRSTRECEPEYHARFEWLATQIEIQLQNWLPPLETQYITNESSKPKTTHQNSVTSAALCLQWAAFMRLHQVRYGYNKSDVRITACLQHILAALRGIPVSSHLEAGLVFPLIMAGSAATNPEDKEYILFRLHSLKSRLKFGYIEKIEKMLQTVWERDCVSFSSSNWASIRYYEFPGIVMF